MDSNQFQLIKTADELRTAAEELSKYQAIGFDTETTDLDPYRGRLRLLQFAAPDGVRVVDLYAFGEGGYGDNPALDPLRRLLAALRPVKIAHNAKFDAKWVKRHLGMELGGIFDTLLASQLISAGDQDHRHGLAVVAERYVGESVDKSERLSDWGGLLSDSQLEYAARDASVLLPLREKMIEHIKADSLTRVAQLEFECVMPVAQLELTGFFVDRERWLVQLKWVEEERIRLWDELQEMLAGGAAQGSLFGRAEINIDSHPQLTEALRGLGIPVPESTRNWQMQPLAERYPVIAKLLEYRTMQKAATSYGENLLEYISPATGRLHADFRQIGAPTGRFSCSNPNIQQVPHGPEYRRCFRAPEGRKLVIADYSQIELRILAEFSGDQRFIDAFNSGADFHKVTAAQVFGVAPENVTVDQRSFAKRLNFGVVYGIGAQRFALMTGLQQTESEDVLRKYFGTYRGLDAYLRDSANRAVREKCARTASGRIARFRFDENDRQQVSATQRNGKNMPIQGTSADILKRALRLLHDELRETSADIVNIIHDEVVVECSAAEADDVVKTVERAMVAAGEEYISTVAVKVDAEVKDEWLK